MADLISITDSATEVVAALDEYGDFSVDMTATEFVAEVNDAIDAGASVSDTATELVGKINEAADAEPVAAPNPVKFLHYSDIHGNTSNTEKAVSVMTSSADTDYDADVDFAILSGDNADAYYSSVATALTNADVNTNGKHLVIMGNHDIGSGPGDPISYKCNHANMVNALRSYMVNAGVTYGGEGTAYWHKDFPLGNGGKLRVIATDEYDIGSGSATYYESDFSQAQINWFIGLLEGLTSKDYFVVITHKYPVKPSEVQGSITQYRARNKFTSSYLYEWGNGTYANMGILPDIIDAYKRGRSINKTCNNYNIADFNVVHDFGSITSKATFVCFVCGHLHGEFCGAHPVHTDQLVLDIDCAKNAATIGNNAGDESDIPTASRTGILMNKVTIDFAKHQVKVDRIGAKNVPARTIDKVNDQHDAGDSHEDGYTYPALTRDTITFDFTTAQVVESEVNDDQSNNT